jgi:hypothetical protein
MNLLTLDLASRIGFTCGPMPLPGFSFGSYQLPKTGTDIGSFIWEYDKWLRTMLEEHEVWYVVFEQPILHKMTQIATLRKLYGLCSHTEYVCTEYQVKCREVNVQAIKRFMGVKRYGAEGKQDMVDAVARYGYKCEDHDAADACGLRLYTVSVERPEALRLFRLELGPLGAAAS